MPVGIDPPTRDRDVGTRRRDRRVRVRPMALFVGAMLYLALVAGHCDSPEMALSRLGQLRPDGSQREFEGELATGEPKEVTTEVSCHFYCGGFIDFGVTWKTSDPSVATVTGLEADDDGYPRDGRQRRTATVVAVAPGTAEIVATSNHQPWVETRASVTVTDDAKFGFMEVVDGDRTATMGATLAVEVDLTLYGSPDPEDTLVEWEIDDPQVVNAEDATRLATAPYVYRNTLLLRTVQVGATTVRVTHPLAPDHDPWDLLQPVIEVPVTIAPEGGTAFVVIRDGDRTVDLGDTVCVTAYVGMPAAEPNSADSGIDWSLTTAGVVEPVSVRWIWWSTYPFEVEVCLDAIGPGVTELVATSRTWPDASARVSIEVIE